MFNLLRADLYVLVRSRALWIALAASSAMAVGYYASAHLIAVGAYDESISGSVAGFSDAMALPLLGSMLIGVVVASDLENRTVHDRLLAASRSALVAVKTVMALVVADVVLLPYIAQFRVTSRPKRSNGGPNQNQDPFEKIFPCSLRFGSGGIKYINESFLEAIGFSKR